eukprot:4735558-Alexandrium_andersonii.AAC.1
MLAVSCAPPSETVGTCWDDCWNNCWNDCWNDCWNNCWNNYWSNCWNNCWKPLQTVGNCRKHRCPSEFG